METHTIMLEDLKKLGVKENSYLLVHSSYKSLGPSVKDIEQITATLQAAVGQNGTLLFPALSYKYANADNPHFDIQTTPSCVGAIPEWFRQQPGVFRSMSPTHSVTAIGSGAKDITSDHDLDDTPVGPHSPLSKLRDLNGQILMLGCGLCPNTSMHGVEELTQPPYLFKGTLTYACTNQEGAVKALTIRCHNFKNSHGESIEQRYGRLRYILPKDVLKSGYVLDAECYLLEARPMWDIAESVLSEDPLFFVDGY